MPTYRGSATLCFAVGGRNFVLESLDCSAHVREASSTQLLHGMDHDPGRWTAIGVFGVRTEEDALVRAAFLALPEAARNSTPVFDIVLCDVEGAAIQGRMIARRMEEASRGALLLTLTGLGLPTIGCAGTLPIRPPA